MLSYVFIYTKINIVIYDLCFVRVGEQGVLLFYCYGEEKAFY